MRLSKKSLKTGRSFGCEVTSLMSWEPRGRRVEKRVEPTPGFTVLSEKGYQRRREEGVRLKEKKQRKKVAPFLLLVFLTVA